MSSHTESAEAPQNLQENIQDDDDDDDDDDEEEEEEEEEEGDDDDEYTENTVGDLTRVGSTVTSIKFQAVRQQSFQQTERGAEEIVQSVLGSDQASAEDIVPASLHETADTGTRVLQRNYIQVQQQFGDLTIHGSKYLSLGGTQIIGSSGPHSGGTVTAQTWTEKLFNRTLTWIQEWTKDMVQTSAFEQVLNKVNSGAEWIIIKGSPGEGKTTVAYMTLAELHRRGRQVFQVLSTKEFNEITSTCQRPVIMLDDIFGNLEFDQVEWSKWKPVLHQVLEATEHRAQEKKEVESQRATIILVGRDYVLSSASFDLGKMTNFSIHEGHVVNMSCQVHEPDEKLAILKAISESKGLHIPKSTMEEICRCASPHGFPYVCRLFVTFHKSDYEFNAEAFFKSPLQFLNQTIARFVGDKLKLLLFKKMIQGNGRVSVRELGKLDTGTDLILVAYRLVDTYLRKDDDYFLFDHPSIYDSVAYNLCKLYPLFVIENCSLQFIRERLRLQNSIDSRVNIVHKASSQINESDLVVYIPRSYNQDLAQRFATEIINKNLLQVLSHTAFSDELFVKEVMSYLSLPLQQLLSISDCTSSEVFLTLAASNKSSQLLKYFDNQTDFHLTQQDLYLALYGVCKYAAGDALMYLMKKHNMLDINVRYGDKQQTPLMISTQSKDSNFVHQIMSLNPKLNIKDISGKTCLHYMCENGLLSVAKEVTELGIDINEKDRLGRSPLYCACIGNHLKVVKMLLERNARIDLIAIEEACKMGSLDIVKILFEVPSEENIGKKCDILLHSACSGGHVKMIKFLIEKGGSCNTVDVLGRSPLHKACMYNKPLAAQLLIDQGAITEVGDNQFETPLHTSVVKQSKECIDVLVMAGVDVNAQRGDGSTPVHTAVRKGYKSCLLSLLKAKAVLGVQDEDGHTPLHIAAQMRSSTRIAEMLLKNMTDVNIQSAVDKQTPLHKAVYSRMYPPSNMYLRQPNFHVSRALITYGADVNSQDSEGNTPLHLLSCIEKSTKIDNNSSYDSVFQHKDMYRKLVCLLVSHGANVNICNTRGEPALHGLCQAFVARTKVVQEKKENCRVS